jgi:hypothetical protein
MKITRKKARKLRKKRANTKRLHEVLEDTSQKEKIAELELRRDIRTTT